MVWQVEEAEEEKILLIWFDHFSFVKKIKEKLSVYHYRIFSSTHIPKNIHEFSFVFIFFPKNPVEIIKKIKEIKSKTQKFFFIIFNQKNNLSTLIKLIKKDQQIKAVSINNLHLSSYMIDQIFWFFFSQSRENFINLKIPFSEKKQPKKAVFLKEKFFNWLNWKKISKIVFIIFLCSQLFFLFPMTITGLLTFKTIKEIEKEKYEKAKLSQKFLKISLSITKKTYSFSRPLFSFFYLAILPDKIISLEENFYDLITNYFYLMENGKKIILLILKKEKTPDEKIEFNLRWKILIQKIDEVLKIIQTISPKITFKNKHFINLKNQLVKAEESLLSLKKLLPFTDEILGKNKEKKYLLLFQNNMELRPGGGFIGSFGIVTFSDYTLKDIKIEDVYEADGQLKSHIEPPPPIRLYLNQPHWFLRDSNFSADFSENFKQAEYFLEKELGLKNFDGGMAITTTAIKNILEAFGEIYLPDYKEKINKDNFYLKTQFYVEKDFFPGSIQKKTFLAALVRRLLLELEHISFNSLLKNIEKSLLEKQIVLYFKNPKIDNLINSLGWGGRIIKPVCVSEKANCVIDYLFPIDANLGVNKANFFISRLINTKINFYPNGEIETTLIIKFKNESLPSIFPGGDYKNYFQLYLPSLSEIIFVKKDEKMINDWEVKLEDEFKILSFFFFIPSSSSSEIKIGYRLKKSLNKGRNVYQLIVQKQIGSLNNDFILEIFFPKNIYILNQNFSALAKNQSLVYNTNLLTDKIFLIDILKE